MTVHRLRDIHKTIFPDILFLMETKNDSDFVLQNLQWMGYSSNFLVSPHSQGAGGLALFWKQNLEMEIIFSCQHYIDAKLKVKGRWFFATFLYGEPDRIKRSQVWQQLQEYTSSRSEPWFLTGDFNDIINASEKVGGPPRSEGFFTDLRSFMSTCDLYDLKHTWSFLSWRGHRYSHLVKCRLDRAMANSGWAEAYPTGRSEYVRFEGSYHRPLVSSFDPKEKNGKVCLHMIGG